MAGRMFGENLLPESVNERRRNLRSRVQGLREPIRSRRENLVPGPDVIGRAESRVADLRDRVLEREGVLSRIRARRADGGEDSGQDTPQMDEGDTGSSTRASML